MGNYTAIIILQYGNYQDTIACIESVEQYNTAAVKYIIVDNCSPDGVSADKVKQYLERISADNVLDVNEGYKPSCALPKFTLVRSHINDGYARGNNKGINIAFEDPTIKYLLILNNDILFVDNIIPQLINDINSTKDAGLISPLLYKRGLTAIDPNCARYEGRVRDSLVYNFLLLRMTKAMAKATFMQLNPDSGLTPVQLISGSCIMVDKDLFKEIDAFDPGTFLYQEENILWEKMKRAGKKNYVDTNIKCIHLGASTTGKAFSFKLLKQSLKSQNYFIKNYVTDWRLLKLTLITLSQWWLLTAFKMRDIIKNR